MSLAHQIRVLTAERNAEPCGWDDDRAPLPTPEPEPPTEPYALTACQACHTSSPRCRADGGVCCNACHHPTTLELPPRDGPTDLPYREDDARWHADEAQALAKLAELTTKRSPWMAATEMDWSTT